jgi:hypothetical protein
MRLMGGTLKCQAAVPHHKKKLGLFSLPHLNGKSCSFKGLWLKQSETLKAHRKMSLFRSRL